MNVGKGERDVGKRMRDEDDEKDKEIKSFRKLATMASESKGHRVVSTLGKLQIRNPLLSVAND